MNKKMKHLLLLTALVGVFVVDANEAEESKTLPNLECQPRPSVIQTKPMFFPYFVSLHRCNGSRGLTPPSKIKCVPKKIELKKVIIDSGSHRHHITMQNHTECETQCVNSREDCKSPMVYYPDRCACECKHSTPPKGLGPCKEGKKWSKVYCACRCENDSEKAHKCQKRHFFDHETCTCKCKPGRKRMCEALHGIFKPETCGCRKAPQRHTSPDDKKSGSFVGSTAFWVYILIGEFVLLLIIFDAILCCKQMGVLYRVTRRCRKTHLDLSHEEGDMREDHKILKGHYNDVCDSAFSSMQDVSKPCRL